VLAVGNPFNLTSTVTAGIISAKARNINILPNQKFPIESFIQTDAAVNPGNSGGALVNTRGELIGINAAIASNTGSYSGYSFAIPVNIVKKVVNDLMEYGTVQRGFIGVSIRDLDAQFAKEKELKSLQGVYVNGLKREM
jgi:serine protease Do